MEDKVSDTLLQREYAKQQEKIAELEAKFSVLGDDISRTEADTETMTTSTDYRHELQLRDEQLRRELDLRQETFRAEQSVRDAAWNERFSGFLGQQAERDKRLDASISAIAKSQDETKSSVSSLKTTIIVTAVSTVLAIVVGVASFNATLTSNMFSAFQAGKGEQASQVAPVLSTPPPSQPAAPPSTDASPTKK